MKRSIRILLSFFVLLAVLGTGVSAATTAKPASKPTPAPATPAPAKPVPSNAPAAVSKVSAKQMSETSVKLSWKKASKASGYYIYQVDAAGKMKQIGKTSKTNFTVKKMKPGTVYTFCVCSYRKVKKATVKATAVSQKVSVKTKVLTPGKPDNFRVTSTGSGTVSLAWGKAKNATGYAVLRYDSTKKAYVELSKTKKLKVTVKGLKNGEENKFIVRAYRSVKGVTVWGKDSSAIKFTTKALSAAVKSIRSAYYTAKLRRTVVVPNLTTKKNQTLKKGLKVVVNAKSGRYVTGYVTSGGKKNKVKIKRSDLQYTGLDALRKNDYSKSVKQEFVNSKGYRSNTKWLIWISQYKCTVNVFKGKQWNWKLVKEFPCIVGKWSTRTPNGVHRIIYKSRYGKYGGVYIRFTQGGNAFHRRVDGTKLGRAASHGCIRMSDSALLYLYNNCPTGTAVIAY